MKPKSVAAFTRLDLLIVVGILVMLAIWFMYAQLKRNSRAPQSVANRVNCASNLKAVGLAFRIWSNDHAERFPWQVPIGEGGTKELADLPYAALHYLAASNELVSPKI